MKAFALLLLASLPVPRVQTFPRVPVVAQFGRTVSTAVPRSHGRWYFARSGHAVYCYGPVMTMADVSGHIEHVATFCRGSKLMVPLRD